MENYQYIPIYVTTLVGNAKGYCELYIGKCDNFEFRSFELKNIIPTENAIYAGFVGEFIGSEYGNKFDDSWKSLIQSKGLTVINDSEIRDTVASQYGNLIMVTIKK